MIMPSLINLMIFVIVMVIIIHLVRTYGTLLFRKNMDTITDENIEDAKTDVETINKLWNTPEERNVKVLPSSNDDYTEMVEVNGRLGIRLKEHRHAHSPHCRYCGSRNINNYTCNQCGAPTG